VQYAEFISRTNYSFLRGASHPEELIDEAALLGYRALAITDRNGVYALPKAFQKAKAHPGFHFISGAEVMMENHPPIYLIALDRAGYGRMCTLLTAAHADKEKGAAALSFDALTQKENGLVAIGSLDKGTNWARLKETFREAYVPLGRFLDGHDEKRTKDALTLEKKFNLPILATNDVHYHMQRRRPLHDVVTSVREGVALKNAGFHLFPNGERYLKKPEAMHALFKDLPRAIENGLELADRCAFSLSELRYRYPTEWIPESHTAQSFLEKLTWDGAKVRFKGSVPEAVIKQIKYELSLIAQLGYADYFLTIWDVVEFAKKQKILCQGRGSAANSVVCYSLGITAIDPVRMDLLFERFISVERGEPPDIDVDFEHERREEVIQYLYEKYGRNRAGMVSAVITYRTRSAIREIAKAVGVEVGTLSAKKVEKSLEEDTKERKLLDHFIPELKGFPRHLSIHSGGFCLSADPIIESVPVEPARMDGRTIIQWDKYDLDILGLMKVDVLSLGMLTALRRTLDNIGMKLEEIPDGDKKTYDMICKCDTVGTFQIESRAQISMLGRLQPRNFYDLVVEVAIVRPGPIQGNMVHPYLKRRRGEEPVTFPHPKLEKILKKTLGVPLFQEQVMKIAVELGGFTPGEADELRRSLGTWRNTGTIQRMGQKLMSGLIASGLTQEYAQRIYDQIQGFAEYGFPESHAASFALLAYASCYVKCHHPAEFTCALINSQPMGFYANHTLIDDVRRHGVRVLPVDPSHSVWECKVTAKNTIRLGWNVMKGLSKKEAEKIIAGAPYESLEDFLNRNNVRRDVLERMAMGEVFQAFGLDQRHTLWRVLAAGARNQELPQLELFSKSALAEVDSQKIFRSLTAFQELKEHYNAFGLSPKAHPMCILRKSMRLPTLTSLGAKGCSPGARVQSSGLVLVRQKPPTAKGTAFATLEDEFGFLDLIFRPEVFERVKEVFLEHCFLRVEGKLQRDRNTVSILVDRIAPVFSDSDRLMIEPTTYFYA
jgi:error-prone DNA polymerase